MLASPVRLFLHLPLASLTTFAFYVPYIQSSSSSDVLHPSSLSIHLHVAEITMFETLLRPIDVTSTPKPPSIEDATQRLKAAEVKREDKRRRQIQQNREKEARDKASKERKETGEQGEGPVSTAEKRKQEEEGDEADAEWVDVKRVKTSDVSEDGGMQVDDSMPTIPVISTSQITFPLLPSSSTSTSTPAPGWSSSAQNQKVSVSKALPEVRGHTSYLTFATLVPYAYAQRMAKEKGKTNAGVGEGEDAEKAKETTAEDQKGGHVAEETKSAAVLEGKSRNASTSRSAEPEEKGKET